MRRGNCSSCPDAGLAELGSNSNSGRETSCPMPGRGDGIAGGFSCVRDPECRSGTTFSFEHIGQLNRLPANPTGLENFCSQWLQKNLKISSSGCGRLEEFSCSLVGIGIPLTHEEQAIPLLASPRRISPQVAQKKLMVAFSPFVASMARRDGGSGRHPKDTTGLQGWQLNDQQVASCRNIYRIFTFLRLG